MLVKRDGRSDFVKVLDFGAPKLTQLEEIFGMLHSMAPEQSASESTDVRSDLYSLGIILYELIAGTQSQSAPSIKVPKAVEALVQRRLAKSPEEREISEAPGSTRGAGPAHHRQLSDFCGT